MNRFVIAALAATLIAPVAEAREPRAETRQEGRGPAQRKGAAAQPVPGHQYRAAVGQPHAWRAGERFDRRAAPVVHIDHFGLKPPPAGHVWVRSGTDALLVRVSGPGVASRRSGMFS